MEEADQENTWACEVRALLWTMRACVRVCVCAAEISLPRLSPLLLMNRPIPSLCVGSGTSSLKAFPFDVVSYLLL